MSCIICRTKARFWRDVVKPGVFGWFIHSWIVFMLIIGWVSYLGMADPDSFKFGTVEACLGSNCFDESSAPVSAKELMKSISFVRI